MLSISPIMQQVPIRSIEALRSPYPLVNRTRLLTVGFQQIGITANASSCVHSKLTGQATPSLAASSQVCAHTHQRSPAFNPGKLNWGAGVIKSLPFERANWRKSSVTMQHTTCEPRSLASVLQQPSRNHPVIGSVEHGWSSVPLTFTLSCMELPQLTMGSSLD